MGFGTALARLEELGAAALALLPGLLLGLAVFRLFALLGRLLRAGLVRAARARGVSPAVGIVPGRIGAGFCPIFGGLVTAAIAFPSIKAADLFSVLGIGNGDDIARAKRLAEGAARRAEACWPSHRRGHWWRGWATARCCSTCSSGSTRPTAARVLARMKPALAAAGIYIPYATMQVLLHAQTKATDGDRARQREGWPARGSGQDPAPRWRARDGADGRTPRPKGAAAATGRGA